MIKKIIPLALLVFISATATGKTLFVNGSLINVGSINMNGSGCPNGTLSVTTPNDNSLIVIKFDHYNAITNSTDTIAISDCNISIPLSIAPGYSVGISGIDWHGVVVNAPNAFINFHREYFFSGERGPSLDSNWTNSGYEYFSLNDSPSIIHYSGCDGSPLIARIDTSAAVIGANSFFSLQQGSNLALHVRPC